MGFNELSVNSWIRPVRWAARLGSLFSIGLLALFFIGEFRPASVGQREWVGLLFFPVGVVAGMLIGWRREGLGGAISVLSLLAFYLIYGLLMNASARQGVAFVFFTLPGVLFLLSHCLGRRNSTAHSFTH